MMRMLLAEEDAIELNCISCHKCGEYSYWYNVPPTSCDICNWIFPPVDWLVEKADVRILYHTMGEEDEENFHGDNLEKDFRSLDEEDDWLVHGV